MIGVKFCLVRRLDRAVGLCLLFGYDTDRSEAVPASVRNLSGSEQKIKVPSNSYTHSPVHQIF
jgi:hypothetical protein